ncbi:MAG: TetR/AcrR family transcriptional regulator [Dehalococcoidia bacterium]
MRLFAERGYHATSMRDIAAELDLQGGSLYAHTASKEDLLWQAVSRAADEFVRRAAEATAAEPDPIPRLHRLVLSHVDYMTAARDNAIVFHHEWRFLSPERRERVAGRRREYEAYFRQAIEDGARTGAFRVSDPKVATLAVLSLVNWLYQWYRPEGVLSPAEIGGQLNGLVDGALGVAPQTERRS